MALDSASVTSGAPVPEDGETPLAAWVKRMCEVELPAVSTTVMKIQQLSQDDDCAVQALADVILQDAAMTAHVLRLTSSAYHVRGSRSNSITRALVILGFKEVRAICLSIAVLDDLIKKTNQKPFTTELARAFHAAVQVEQLACSIGDRSPQEVFIATLLHNLGQLLFWCFGEEKRDELEKAYEVNPKLSEAEVEKKVLGFELRELTEALAKKWGLGDLLIKAINPKEAPNPRTKGIRVGHRFVRAVEKGWDSPEAQKIMAEMSEMSGMSPTVLAPMLQSAAVKAREIATEFAAPAAAQQIPLAPPPEELKKKAEEAGQASTFVPQEPDPAYHLRALQDISLKLESKPDVQELIDLVMEGIYRGLGMDRALFAILSPNRRYLSGKSAFGFQSSDLISHFKFPLDSDVANIFQAVVDGSQALWVHDQKAPEFVKLITKSVRQVIGDTPFFAAPTIVTGKPIGVIFADRFASKRPLDASLFQGFKQFAVTANISLEHLKHLHAGK